MSKSWLRAPLLLLLLLGFVTCGDDPNAPGADGASNEPDSVLPDRAIAFAEAGTTRDVETCLALCSEAARPFFEAEAEFSKLLLVEGSEPRAEATRTATTVRVERDTARVRVDTKRGDGDSSSYFVLKREDGEWRVDGFADSETDAPRRFADLTAGTLARIERAKAERTPHAELGPIVEAYLRAAAAKDGEAMFALMTPECAKREVSGSNAFTAGFLAGRFKVSKWHFAKHDVEGDEGTQRIRTILELADGEMDGEPLRFQFRRVDGAWKIATIE